MVSPAIYEYLTEFIPKENILLQETMDKHTTFQVGGMVEAFIQIDSKDQLIKLIPYFNKIEKEYFIVGNGSNLLVSDKGYKGIVIQMGPNLSNITFEGTQLTVEAGALLTKVAKAAAEYGLSGLEFAAGIPGTVGGAIVMNAGAYEGEMSHVVKSVTLLDREGNLLELDRATMEFGYRTSIIRKTPFIVVEVVLELQKGDSVAIMDKMEEFNKRRRDKQPLEYPSAGSTFKRPVGYFAGKLIMEAGLCGHSLGGAKVAEKHCGFIVNGGNATATEIWELISEVSFQVKQQFGVTLEPEVICLGDFSTEKVY